MTIVTTFSASATSLLSTRGAEYRPLWSPQSIHDYTQIFDEGPRLVPGNVNPNLSGSMDTTAVDAYVQGVEITRMRQYDAGVAKIWSGDPGHYHKQNTFGSDKGVFPGSTFTDKDLFNPVKFIHVQESSSPLWSQLMTFPIVTSDNSELENFNFNGVIEPLTIRSVASFFSIETPYIAHAVKGTLAAGNIDQQGATDRILTVDNFEPTRMIDGFLDMSDHDGSFFGFEHRGMAPFTDEHLIRNVSPVASEPSDMSIALGAMSPASDNYVKHNQRSATSGFIYDDVVSVGTDSLSFGGMTQQNWTRVPPVTQYAGPIITSITPNTGSSLGGTAITDLHGSGFVAGAYVTFSVYFGSLKYYTSAVFVSSEKLTCVTPAMVDGFVGNAYYGHASVIVTNPDGSNTETSGANLFWRS